MADDGDDLIHRYHAQCNPDRALCGVDLSGQEEYDEGPDDLLCVVCEELVELNDCTVTCRLVVFE